MVFGSKRSPKKPAPKERKNLPLFRKEGRSFFNGEKKPHRPALNIKGCFCGSIASKQNGDLYVPKRMAMV